MNLIEAVNAVADMCTERMLHTGECPPSLFVVGDKRMAAVMLLGFGESSEDRENQLFMLGQSISDLNKDDTEIGLLQSVIFAGEAYMRRSRDEEPTEILLIAGHNPRIDAHYLVVYELLRSDNGDLQDVFKLDVPENDVPDHSVLTAFSLGYYAKSSGVN